MIESLFIMLVFFVVFMLGFVFLKGSFLDLDTSKGFIWSLHLYKAFFVVSLPLVLLNLFSLNELDSSLVFTRQEDVFWISMLSLFFISLTFLLIVFLTKLINIDYEPKRVRFYIESSNEISRFSFSFAAVGVALLFIAMLFFNYNHSFIKAALFGGNVLSYRLHNAYGSSVPTYLMYLIILSYIVCSLYSGAMFAIGRKKKGLIYLVLAVFLSSAGGAKAPVVTSLLIVVTSYLSVNMKRISVKRVLFFIAWLPFVYFFIYFVVSFQIPDLTFEVFNKYLLERIGTGQMAGVFETFSLPSKLQGDFYLHMIPFASIFSDYISYDKALMMYVENYEFSEMGVKNSFFISEAYGIGGVGFLLVSPLLFAFNFVMGIKILFWYLKVTVGLEIASFIAVPLSLLAFSVSGGISSYVFFKGLILQIILISVVVVFYKIYCAAISARAQ